MNLEPQHYGDFNPYDTMLRIAQQGHNNSNQLLDCAETIQRLTHLAQIQSQRIDHLEQRLSTLEIQNMERGFDDFLKDIQKKG